MFVAPNPSQREASSLLWPDAVAVVGAMSAGSYFVTASTEPTAIRDRTLYALRREGYCGYGDVTVLSDGAEILKRLPRALPKPTTHIIDWFHVALRVQPMQQIADYMVRSQSVLSETLSSIDREITAVKWRLWHRHVVTTSVRNY